MKYKKRKRKKRFSASIICIVIIAVLSITGVSYSYWSNDININTIISTGNINPYFSECSELEDLDVLVSNKKITISGEITLGYNRELFFYIKNSGNTPVKCENIINPNPDFFQEVKVPDNILKANNSGEGKLLINPVTEGLYNYAFNIPVKQPNNVGWSRTLAVEVNVVVISPPLIDTTTPGGVTSPSFIDTTTSGAVTTSKTISNE